MIDDVIGTLVDFRRNGERSSAVSATSNEELSAFGQTYCRILNTVYRDFRALSPWRFGGFVCCAFSYGSAAKIGIPEDKDVEVMLEKLCRKRKGPRLFVNRIIRLYEENVVLMIKPDQKRFWLRSVALRDADDTMAELLEAGF